MAVSLRQVAYPPAAAAASPSRATRRCCHLAAGRPHRAREFVAGDASEGILMSMHGPPTMAAHRDGLDRAVHPAALHETCGGEVLAQS